jgi:type II secretory pathway component PulK
MTPRSPDRGVVLITILVVIALCVTVIVVMTATSEQATRATRGDLDAGQARALLSAGEASALSALLRDLDNPPEADGPSEAWANLAQSGIAIPNGRFALEIWDEAARFNLNTLTTGSSWSRQTLDLVTAAAGLKPEVATRISAALKGGKPLLQTADLAPRAGLSAAEIAALDGLVTCTPDLNGGVNINTAPKPLLAALLPNPETLDLILTARDQNLITATTLEAMAVVLPEGLTLRSDVFGIKIAVSSGESHLSASSTVHRWRDATGQAHAIIAARKLGRL